MRILSALDLHFDDDAPAGRHSLDALDERGIEIGQV